MNDVDFAEFVRISKSVRSGWSARDEKIEPNSIITVCINEKDREIFLEAAIEQEKHKINKILMTEQGVEDIIMQGWYAFILKIQRLNNNTLEFLISNEPETLAPSRTFTIEYKGLKMGEDNDNLFNEDPLDFAYTIDSILAIDELGDDLQIVTKFRFFIFSNYHIDFGNIY